MNDTAAKIAQWIALGEPMEAVHCVVCSTLVEVYTIHGVCLECQRKGKANESVD